MTYPQAYQQFPPQPLHQPQPQQPQYGAPQGTPWMPPVYGSPQHQPGQPYLMPPGGDGTQPQQPPQLGGQQPPTAAPKLGESGKGGGGATAPLPRHLVGRTIIIEPIRIDETTTTKDQQGNVIPQPTAYYHLTVVDGGPLQYGDNQDRDISKQHGMTFEVQTPARFTNVQSNRFGIVNEVRDTMARGDMASVGVMVQGTKGNRPFLITKCGKDLDGNDRPDGAQRYETATLVWNQVFAKTFVNPQPRSLVAPPAAGQQPPQVAYQPQQPAQAPAGYAQQPMTQNPTFGQALTGQQPPPFQPMPQQYAPGAYSPESSVSGMPGAYGQQSPTQPAYNPHAIAGVFQPDPNGTFHGPGDQNGTYAAPAQASAPPANPAFEAWLATLPPEQQAAQRAAMAGSMPQAYAPAPAGGPGI